MCFLFQTHPWGSTFCKRTRIRSIHASWSVHIRALEFVGTSWSYSQSCWRSSLRHFSCITCPKSPTVFSIFFSGAWMAFNIVLMRSVCVFVVKEFWALNQFSSLSGFWPVFGSWTSQHLSSLPLTSTTLCITSWLTSDGSTSEHGSPSIFWCCVPAPVIRNSNPKGSNGSQATDVRKGSVLRIIFVLSQLSHKGLPPPVTRLPPLPG